MSDYLSHLIARSSGRAAAIQPRLLSRYESQPFPGDSKVQMQGEETMRSRPLPTPLTPEETTDSLPAVPNPIVRATANLPVIAQPIVSESVVAESPLQPQISSSPASQPIKLASLPEPVAPSPTASPQSEAPQMADPVPVSMAIVTRLPRLEPLPPPVSPGIPPQVTPARTALPLSQPEAPTIRVTIGRIDVRAVAPPSPQPPQAKPVKPNLSLSDYLKTRQGGGG